MAALSLEERVAALEVRMEEVKHRQEQDKSEESVPWWKKIVGVYQDSPAFEEAARLGREWRESQEWLDGEDSV